MRIITLVLLLCMTIPTMAQTTPAEIDKANAAVVQLINQSKYQQALELAQTTLTRAEAALGPNHPETLNSVNNLASLYESQGRYGEAEPLYRRTLETTERVMGSDHQFTLTIANNLAGLLQSQGRYGEAEPLYRRTLEGLERVLGRDHLFTLGSVNNLATLYKLKGQYGEAELLYRRALETMELVLGPDHTFTLNSVNNLASLFESQGRYGEAEPLYRRALETMESALGHDHPNTLTSVNNLAGLYKSKGRYGEAEPLYRRALEGREQMLGPDHPNTLTSVNNLAFLYQSQGRHGEAEPLYRRALEGRERMLGPDHPDTLASVNNLAGLYKSKGRYGEAEPLYHRALEGRKRMLGPDHPDTLASVNNLADLYQSQGRYGEAEPLYHRALEGRERMLGPDHPDTLASVNNLADLYQSQGRYGEAEPLYRRALEGMERVFEPDHPNTLTGVNNLALLYRQQGRYAEAMPLYRRALEGMERVLGTEHPNTLTSVINLADLYQSQGRYEEAEPLYRRALKGRERVLGHDHPDTLTNVINLALLYKSKGRPGEAEPLLRRALEVGERVLGHDHPSTLNSVQNLALLYHIQGRYEEAEALYRRALEGMERVFEPDHPNTIATLGNLIALLMADNRSDEALWQLHMLDERLSHWVDVEVNSTRAASIRRALLSKISGNQDAGFNLAIMAPSAEAKLFAANLTLRWKRRLAPDDAVLNNLIRGSGNERLRPLTNHLKQGRAALSNVAFDPAVPPARKQQLLEQVETVEAELKSASADYRQFIAWRNATAEQVSKSLKTGEALVEYRLFNTFDFKTGKYGDQHLLAIILASDRLPALVDLGEAEASINVALKLVDAELRKGAAVPYDAVARSGFDRIIAPLLPHLSDISALYLSPDGPLMALPFEALLDADGKRLVERWPIHMLQTGRDLVVRDRPVLGKGLVAMGGIDFTANAGTQVADKPTDAVNRQALDTTREQIDNFRYLKESKVEAANIVANYKLFRPDEPAPVHLAGRQATEAALKALNSPPRVLHLATHGYYLKSGSVVDQPLLQSGIALAGADMVLKGQSGPDGENGILHALEAQTLNLYGTELVVLSACDTGKGAVDYSEGLEGLPRALYVAGARNILVAVTPVGDLTARLFMERFYEIWLAQLQSDPAKALRETKLEYIRDKRDPAGWAPFILFEG